MERKTKTLTLTPRLTVALAGTVMACLLIGGILSYAMSGLATSSQIHDLQNQVSTLKQTVSDTQSQDSSSSQTSTIVNSTYIVVDNFSLPELYEKTKNSVVVVRATTVTEYYGSWGNLTINTEKYKDQGSSTTQQAKRAPIFEKFLFSLPEHNQRPKNMKG